MARFTIGATFAMMLMVQYSPAQTTRYVGNCQVSSGYFTAITDALNAASPGDTINVCPGAYSEQLIIEKASITIQGISSHDSSQVDVQGRGDTSPTVVSSVFGTVLLPTVRVAATGVTIKNISAEALCPGGSTGVAFYIPTGTLNHVKAYGGCGGASVWSENASTDILGVTIENSVMSEGGYGILAASKQPANTIPVLSVTITGNQIQDPTYGIYLSGVEGSVSGNFITANGDRIGPIYGIWDAAPASVSGNTITNEIQGTGIRIGAANASVTNNVVTSLSGAGIDFNCLSVMNVTGNAINASNGIYHVPTTFSGTNKFFNTKTNRTGGC